jgi:RimJ/RimL family protein N-acetyltransferase
MIYDPEHPRSCALDPRRELTLPTLDEVREAMGQKEMGRTAFSAIEDAHGSVRGFCSLRGINPELSYSEFVLIFLNDADYGEPMADEVFDHLCTLAFERTRLTKVITHCLDNEVAYRNFLMSHGFRSDGKQRELVYGRGRWYDLEALSLFREWTSHNKVA